VITLTYNGDFNALNADEVVQFKAGVIVVLANASVAAGINATISADTVDVALSSGSIVATVHFLDTSNVNTVTDASALSTQVVSIAEQVVVGNTTFTVTSAVVSTNTRVPTASPSVTPSSAPSSAPSSSPTVKVDEEDDENENQNLYFLFLIPGLLLVFVFFYCLAKNGKRQPGSATPSAGERYSSPSKIEQMQPTTAGIRSTPSLSTTYAAPVVIDMYSEEQIDAEFEEIQLDDGALKRFKSEIDLSIV